MSDATLPTDRSLSRVRMFAGLKNLSCVVIVFAGLSATGAPHFSNTNHRNPKWPKGVIKIALSTSLTAFGSGIRSGTDANAAVVRSLQKWEEAADVEFEIVLSETSAISPAGTAGDGISLLTIGSDTENIVAFSKDASNASALTRVFFDRNGNITEADIALNPTQQFSTDLTTGTYDLEAVLTHEIGHLLGLKHSIVASSAMFDGISRNNFPGSEMRPRPLSVDDVSKARALYGPGRSTTNCCVSIIGKALPGSTVWIQDAALGTVVHSTRASKDGSFDLGGVQFGRYEIFTQHVSDGGDRFSAASAGILNVKNAEPQTAARTDGRQPISFAIEYIGLTEQVSNRPVRLVPGENYRLTVAGKGLKFDGLSFRASSPKITLIPLRLALSEYPGGIPALGFEMVVDPSLRPGQYSLFVQDRDGGVNQLLGCFWVE